MKPPRKEHVVLLIILLVGSGFQLAEWLGIPRVRAPVSTTVEAIVGRPLTPVSVAGVARRTARRLD